MRYVHSLNQALKRIMARDDRVHLIGEDIVDPYGGAFKVTKGLSTEFPDRVWAAPISEAGIVGLAGGMALNGLKPVVEIMFGDFVTLAADQIINHLAKYRAMYAGQVDVPAVIRTPVGAGRGYGPTHSQSLEGLFLGTPHLKVVCPSTWHDPGRLLEAAVNDSGPVIFVEPKLLYPVRLAEPDRSDQTWTSVGPEPYPIMVGRNYDRGRAEVSLLSYGEAGLYAADLLGGMAREEIKLQIILPSRLNGPDGDLLAELTAGSALLTWEQNSAQFGWGGEKALSIVERLGPGNPHPSVRRAGAWPTVWPCSQPAETEMRPGSSQIERLIYDLVAESMGLAVE